MSEQRTEADLRDTLAWNCEEAVRWIEEAPGDSVPDLEPLTTQMEPIAEQLGYRGAPIDSTGGFVRLADPYEGYWPPEIYDLSPCSKSTAITTLKRWVRMLKGPNELPTERYRRGNASIHTPDVPHVTTAGSETGAWAPPKGYIGSKEICKDEHPPRPTLQKWADADEPSVVKHPSSGECFYPVEWVERRRETYRPRSKHNTKA